MSKSVTYPIVSSTKRIFTRLFDYLVVILISCLSNFLFLYFIVNDWNLVSATNVNYDAKLFSGMYLLSSIFSTCIWFMYFIVIQYLTKGYTLISFISKCKLYWEKKDNIWKRLFLHEGLVIFIFYIINVIIALISFASNNPVYFLIDIFTFGSISTSSMALEIISKIIFVVIAICMLMVVGVIVNTCLNNKKSTYLDDTYDIYMIDVESRKKETKQQKQKPKKLPGIIDEEALEEI